MKYNYIRKKQKPTTLTRSNSSRGRLRASQDTTSNFDTKESKFSAGNPVGGGLSIGGQLNGTVTRFNEPVKQPKSFRVRSHQGRGPATAANMQLTGINTGQPMHKMKNELIKRFNLDQHDQFGEAQAAEQKPARRNRNSFNGRMPVVQ